MELIDIIGWLGSAFVVIAYFLNIVGKMRADSIPYILMNIAGSACLIVNTVYHKAIPSAAVNVVWIVIAVFALIKRPKKLSS
jgi:hypothetical protein